MHLVGNLRPKSDTTRDVSVDIATHLPCSPLGVGRVCHATEAVERAVKLETAEGYRKLAEEMRVLAESLQDRISRAKIIMAAENYDRVADSFDAIEKSLAQLLQRARS